MLKKILIVLGVLIAGFVLLIATRPDSYRVERSVKIDAPAALVFTHVDDFKAWAAWSPWERLDPQMQKTFSGAEHGKGAAYAWQGNQAAGKGRMEITESRAPEHIAIALEFIEPFPSKAEAAFDFKAEGENAVMVTWAMSGPMSFMGKLFGLFVSMDDMIGTDFDVGLAKLEELAETEAKQKAAEADAKADAEAAAAAAATAAAAPAAAPTK